jgi:drug/metabolite transporter (DMT)-like permease
MLLALTVTWGSAFLLTKIAVTELPPDLVVAGRLVVACLLLVPLAAVLARRPPRGWRVWLFFVLIALFGNALPFMLIAWGQRAIDSGLAGILMAIMPLATLGLAHFFVADERLTVLRALGFLLGFAGVVVLMGPEALAQLGNGEGELLPMAAVLAGAFCYAVSSILARLRPASDALSSAAATTLIAALLLLPFVLTGDDLPLLPEAGPAALIAVGLLGVFSTAFAAVVYFRLITSAGPAFVSQLNYLIPVWAVIIGILLLDESPQPNHLYALALILGGILVTQFEQFRARLSRRPA